MASTRNKNTPGNYESEQVSLNQQKDWLLYEHGAGGRTQTTYLAGNGLLAGRHGPDQLSSNATDIESFLYGVGSTNLVNPQGPVVPLMTPIKSLNIFQKGPVYVPKPLVVERGQRPLWGEQ